MKLYVTPGSPYARMARIVVVEKRLESRVEVLDSAPLFAEAIRRLHSGGSLIELLHA